MSTPQVLTSIPATLVPGTTWEWRQGLTTASGSLVDPNDAWTITFYALGKYSFSFTATAQTATSDWLFSNDSTTTASILPGTYQYDIIGVLSSKSYILQSGAVTVLPKAAATAASDQRTHAEKSLALIEAALEGRWTSDVQAYQIHGRALTKIPVLELKKLRTQYRMEVWRERNPGKPFPGMQVTFTLPRY